MTHLRNSGAHARKRRGSPLRQASRTAALLKMATLPCGLQAATPWNPTEPESYICRTERSAGIQNAQVKIGKPHGNNDDPYVGAIDLTDDLRRFQMTITPWAKVPDDIKPAFRERLPDRAAGSGDVYVLSLDRRPELAMLVSLLDDAYIGRAPVETLFVSGPPDPMRDAIKVNGYENSFVFHGDADHAFVVFIYKYSLAWVVEGHCQRDHS